jgi:hypothetical protein
MFRFNAVKDLLLSRFCSSIYSRYNITGIKIHRITRLFNRPKKLQFDHSLDFILEEEEDSIKYKIEDESKGIYANFVFIEQNQFNPNLNIYFMVINHHVEIKIIICSNLQL